MLALFNVRKKKIKGNRIESDIYREKDLASLKKGTI